MSLQKPPSLPTQHRCSCTPASRKQRHRAGVGCSGSGLNVGCMQGKKPKIPEFPVPPDQEEEPEEKQCRAALHVGAPKPLWDACSSAPAAPACCAAQLELILQKQSWLLCRPPKIFHLPVAACSPAVSLIWQHPHAGKSPCLSPHLPPTPAIVLPKPALQ